jgi:ElaB/YqjD/DUF883 family membrane-anchored ribosome-binding protein
MERRAISQIILHNMLDRNGILILNNEKDERRVMNTATSTEKISEALKLLEEAAREKKSELQNMLKGRYSTLKEVLTDKEQDIADALGVAKKRALEAAAHATDISSKRAKEMAEELDEQVHENPWPYIGGVAIGALLVGYILGRK